MHYKYIVLFFVTIIEGPIVTIIAGFLISLGHLNFLLSYILIVIADLTGDSIYYSFGRWGKKRFINKYGKYFGMTTERVLRIEKHFEKHSGKTLFLGKVSHGIGAVFLVAAGMAEMPYQKFLWYNFIATIIKSLILILIGFYFGQALVKINSIFEFAAALSISIGLAFAFGYFIYSRRKKSIEA